MPQPTLTEFLTKLIRERNRIEKEFLSDESKKDSKILEASKNIKEEFKDDFFTFVAYLEMPRPEFIAYWENDEQCQAAISMALRPGVALIDNLLVLLKEIVDYRPYCPST